MSYQDEARAAELDRQRGREEYSRQVADVPMHPSSVGYYLERLKLARGLPCLCGMCRQLIDNEIKEAQKHGIPNKT